MSRVGQLLPLIPALLLVTPAALAAEEGTERKLTPEEIEAWLDSRALPTTGDTAARGGDELLPPPRRHGLLVETSVGALGHLGPLKNISPTSPWFVLRVGYEPLRWLLVFGEGELSFASTSYASPPPEPRTYWLYGFGAGVRFTIALGEQFGVFLQGSAGGARVSEENVLSIYGYADADELNPYVSALLGFEWYQVNPHLGLGLHGGIRDYFGLERSRSGDRPLAWVSALSLRYAF